MKNDRRRFLVAGVPGLVTLFMPNISLACFCRKRRRSHAYSQASTAIPDHQVACFAGFSWSTTHAPSITDQNKITPSSSHNITVYGTGLYAYQETGGTFSPTVQAASNSPAVWGNYAFVSLIPGSSGNLDKYTFSASEMGSSPGSSTITITITTSHPVYSCPGVAWSNQQITYTQG